MRLGDGQVDDDLDLGVGQQSGRRVKACVLYSVARASARSNEQVRAADEVEYVHAAGSLEVDRADVAAADDANFGRRHSGHFRTGSPSAPDDWRVLSTPAAGCAGCAGRPAPRALAARPGFQDWGTGRSYAAGASRRRTRPESSGRSRSRCSRTCARGRADSRRRALFSSAMRAPSPAALPTACTLARSQSGIQPEHHGVQRVDIAAERAGQHDLVDRGRSRCASSAACSRHTARPWPAGCCARRPA